PTCSLRRTDTTPALHSCPTRRSSDLEAKHRIIEDLGNQEHGVGAGDAGFEHLVRIEQEILAQHRQRYHSANRGQMGQIALEERGDRKSTRLNSSHEWMSYAVFCLKKK